MGGGRIKKKKVLDETVERVRSMRDGRVRSHFVGAVDFFVGEEGQFSSAQSGRGLGIFDQ